MALVPCGFDSPCHTDGRLGSEESVAGSKVSADKGRTLDDPRPPGHLVCGTQAAADRTAHSATSCGHDGDLPLSPAGPEGRAEGLQVSPAGAAAREARAATPRGTLRRKPDPRHGRLPRPSPGALGRAPSSFSGQWCPQPLPHFRWDPSPTAGQSPWLERMAYRPVSANCKALYRQNPRGTEKDGVSGCCDRENPMKGQGQPQPATLLSSLAPPLRVLPLNL